MKKFIRSSRPKQMTKNLLIFVPLFFTIDTWISYSYTDIQIIISKSIFTFFSFCCCSIIGYQINDFIDRNLDKFHSVKKNRPLLEGNIRLKMSYRTLDKMTGEKLQIIESDSETFLSSLP